MVGAGVVVVEYISVASVDGRILTRFTFSILPGLYVVACSTNRGTIEPKTNIIRLLDYLIDTPPSSVTSNSPRTPKKAQKQKQGNKKVCLLSNCGPMLSML